MLPKRVVHELLRTSVGVDAKENHDAKHEFDNPALLVTLPSPMIRHHAPPVPEAPHFHCPERQKLQEHCSDIAQFNKSTVPPVNSTLEPIKIPLTQESYKAVKERQHAQQMSETTPLHAKVNDYKQQTVNQREMAASFYKAGEREGALLHTVLAKDFDIKSSLASHKANTMQFMMKSPD